MIAPTASAVANQMRKRTTATERNRPRDVINASNNDLLKKCKHSKRDVPVLALRLLTNRCRLGSDGHYPAHSLALAPKNGVQLTAQQKQQTCEIHPREQHNDRC
jgi:hypothetical protein